MKDVKEIIGSFRYNLYLLHSTSKSGNEYYRLYFDLGYKQQTVSFDKQWISELIHIPVWDFNEKYPLSDKPYGIGYLGITNV